MKQILQCYRNWRIVFLLVLAVVAFLLLIAESDSVRAFVVAKLAALILWAAGIMLFRYWHGEGKLDELDDISE